MFNHKISDNNIEVSIGDNIKGNIKKSDLRDRKEQRTDRFGSVIKLMLR